MNQFVKPEDDAMRKDITGLAVRTGAILCAAALPWALGWPAAAALLMLLPPASEWLRASDESAMATAMAAGLAVSTLLFPVWLRPAIVAWCAVCAAAPWLPVRRLSRRALLWTCAAAAEVVLLLALTCVRFDGRMIPGMAQALTDAVDRAPDSARKLLTAYQLGLSRLTGEQKLLPAVSLFGQIIIPADTRVQMLYSLRLSLELLLESLLPQTAVWAIGLPPVAVMLAAGRTLRRRGLTCDVPGPSAWRLEGAARYAALVLLAMGALQLFVDNPVACYLSRLSMALFSALYLTLGVCALWGLSQRRAGTAAMLVAAVALAPSIMTVIGLVDQAIDLRRLRPPRDDDD